MLPSRLLAGMDLDGIAQLRVQVANQCGPEAGMTLDSRLAQLFT